MLLKIYIHPQALRQRWQTYFKSLVSCNGLLNGYLKHKRDLGTWIINACYGHRCGSLCATLALIFMLAKILLKYFGFFCIMNRAFHCCLISYNAPIGKKEMQNQGKSFVRYFFSCLTK